jgi:hypothetical protein
MSEKKIGVVTMATNMLMAEQLNWLQPSAYLSAGNNDRVLHELEGYGASEFIWDDR